jgi:protein-tyrosine phosphatase/ribose 5-phosphate isomerase B
MLEKVIASKGKNQKTPLKILFICTKNTCRSPMAQAIAQKQLDKKFPGRFNCESVGMEYDHPKKYISHGVAYAVNKNGYGSISMDRWQVHYTDVDINKFDRVYLLSGRYLDKLHSEFPDMRKKILLYNLEGSMPDPFDLEHFPDDWPKKNNPDNRTSEEVQQSYDYVAKQMHKKYTPQIIAGLVKDFHLDKESFTTLCR